MRTLLATLPALLLLASCGSLRETAAVRDDVYDIPDRRLVASVAPVATETAQEEEYYDPGQASQYASGTYANRLYNDPFYYNYSRFGFGYSNFGGYNGMGMGMGMGWNSGFGNNTWYNSPTGWYDPYWANSWQSGYGMYGGNPYGGYYNPWNAGYDPYGWGQPYYGGWSPYGGYNPYMGGFNPYCGGGYVIGGWNGTGSSVVVAHRPGMSGGSTFNGTSSAPRASRGVPSLMAPAPRRDRNVLISPDRGTRTSPDAKPARKDRPTFDRDAQPRERRERRDQTPRTFGGDQGTSPGRDFGGRGGGGSAPSTSPRPRR
jgi:hypothetical protein